MIDKMMVSQNSMSGPKFHRIACVLVHRLSFPLGKTRIFVRAEIGFARKSQIRIRHFDPIGTRWGNHTESACHDDQMLCSTRRENSSPGIGIAYMSTIRNRHSEMVDKMLVLRNSVSGPKFHRKTCVLVH
ncbi:hypothetical protein Taro_009728 [Colocasia esculenta]|uniref:Uncharacterized protein n=1 Tax=Colocasia esculenta TaxID=4460 RepID=A0A843U1N2_COLES|nr:hypothetical protein [Colocasia esculenta]